MNATSCSRPIFEWSARNFDTFKGTVDLYDFFFRTAQETRNVPYFIGSFSGIFDEPWAYRQSNTSSVDGKIRLVRSLWAYKDVRIRAPRISGATSQAGA